MFINYSNHPSAGWSVEQIKAAEKEFGMIRDLPFPNVEVSLDRDAIHALAVKETEKIIGLLAESREENAVMCQGEFTLCFSVVSMLQKAGIRAVSAVTERITEEITENGVSVKKSIFRFAGYREYCRE